MRRLSGENKSIIWLSVAITVALVLLLGGCRERPQASRAMGVIEASSTAYDRNRDLIDEEFLAFYRAQMRKEADKLAEDAIRAETKVVDGQPMANPANLSLIYRKKAQDYRKIEEHIVGMRRKIIAAKRDHLNVLEYSKAMQQYFEQSTNTAEMLNRSSDQVFDAIEAFLKPKPP